MDNVQQEAMLFSELEEEVLLKLIPLLEAQGIMTLDDALRASIKSPYVKISY